ncbi:MobC family plasmid mobilization relaxosome protein [Pseudomaricurvus alcaniphilus]|uniref:plasmid mobilization protein n=1 Tax=Pseudomaricurvus alcaniphilus TaxID=1166482 RepID=UPI0014078D3C|nr:MobC family plasmid mobilization relaxosome protein [Pseudomaricurvus alcaniphilus]
MYDSNSSAAALRLSRINFRITDRDKCALKAKARAANLSLSEFLIRAGLERHISPPPARADLEMLNQIARIGNNVNQLAYSANCGDPLSIPALMELAYELKLLRRCFR